MRCVLAALAAMIMMTSVLWADEPPGKIDAFIAAQLPHSGAPGLAYAVVENGEVTSHTYGEILIDSGKTISPETPFLIGSISKSFTALAIMKLVEAGQVDLEAPVARYLDVFMERPAGNITVRQLLSHTSGYSTFQGNDTHSDKSPSGNELQRQVLRIAQWEPAQPPGTKWQYSNANYLILGALIETVSGQDFASYMNAEILDEMGMTHSFVSDGKSYEQMAVGHQPWFMTKRALKDNTTNRVSAPAGGVVATAGDIGIYLNVMMNGKDDVISAKSKSEILQPASAISPFYGLGWYINTSTASAYHSGLTPGIETLAIVSPDKGQAVIVMINANSGMGFGVNTNLLNGISAMALGHDFQSNQNNWGPKSLFLIFTLLPVLFLIGFIRLVSSRDELYAKSGVFGTFSLWFPFFMTLALAWTSLRIMPGLFGVPLSTFNMYQPDFVAVLIATACSGVLWSVFRLVLYYSNRFFANSSN